MANASAYVPVWGPGVVGRLVAHWYPSSLCHSSSSLWETVYEAYDSPRVRTATTCADAKEQLISYLSPVHTTPWGCLYSEDKHLWFREECHVETKVEKFIDFWKTPGGVFLALTIAALSIFVLWWLSLCYRNRGVVGVCDGLRQLDFDRRVLLGHRRGIKDHKVLDGPDDELIYEEPNTS